MAIEEALIDALGGHLNIVEVEPCTMRIRIQVKSQRDVDEAALRVMVCWPLCAPAMLFRSCVVLSPTMWPRR